MKNLINKILIAVGLRESKQKHNVPESMRQSLRSMNQRLDEAGFKAEPKPELPPLLADLIESMKAGEWKLRYENESTGFTFNLTHKCGLMDCLNGRLYLGNQIVADWKGLSFGDLSTRLIFDWVNEEVARQRVERENSVLAELRAARASLK